MREMAEKKKNMEKVVEAFKKGFQMQSKKQAAEKFTAKRAEMEGFDASQHSVGFVDNPTVEFLQTLYTGYIKNKYYTTKEDSLAAALPIHKAMFAQNPRFYINALKRARKEASIKDQIIIGALVAGDTSIIADMPPSQVQKIWEWGFHASRAKNLIRSYLKTVEEADKLSFYIGKNTMAMRMLVNSAHYKIPTDLYHWMMHSTTTKVRDTMLKDIATVKKEHSLENMEGDIIPWEVARSSVPSDKWVKEGVLEKCDINPYAMLANASTFAGIFGEGEVVKRLTGAKYITSDKFLTAAFAIGDKYPKVTKALADLYVDSVKQTYKKMTLPFELNKLIIVLDVSGSMSSEIQKLLAVAAPFAPVVDKLIFFGDNVVYEDPKNFMTFAGLAKLKEHAGEQSGATNLAGAIRAASNDATKKHTVVIMTDEQGNMGADEESIIRDMRKRGCEVAVVNPTDYAAHMLLHDVIYVPAVTPEGFASALRYTQLRHVTQENIEMLSKPKGSEEEEDEDE